MKLIPLSGIIQNGQKSFPCNLEAVEWSKEFFLQFGRGPWPIFSTLNYGDNRVPPSEVMSFPRIVLVMDCRDNLSPHAD